MMLTRIADFVRLHETALNNATKILKAQGKYKGKTLGPLSVQDF